MFALQIEPVSSLRTREGLGGGSAAWLLQRAGARANRFHCLHACCLPANSPCAAPGRLRDGETFVTSPSSADAAWQRSRLGDFTRPGVWIRFR